MENKKWVIVIVTLLVLIISIATYYYMYQEKDISYQGTFVLNCKYQKV